MPDLNDFKNQLEKIRETVTAKLPDIAEGLAITAKALAERRMKEQGFGVLYSGNKVPAWFLHGKELNARGTKFLENHGVNPATGEPGQGKKKRRKKGETGPTEHFSTLTNWGEFRQAQGLQAAFVDLSYSNKMWANMAPVQIVQQGEIVKALLGATNREAQNKMTWNFERYGDFIRRTLNEDDGKVLGEFVINELGDVIKQIKF